ncbi:hypothetical protein CYMTET_24182, partial [Cymbomonas tetramitiformis]
MNPEFSFDDLGASHVVPTAKTQTPWDFSGAAKEVAETHARFKTTSIDHKIQKRLKGKSGSSKPRSNEEEEEDDDEEDDEEDDQEDVDEDEDSVDEEDEEEEEEVGDSEDEDEEDEEGEDEADEEDEEDDEDEEDGEDEEEEMEPAPQMGAPSRSMQRQQKRDLEAVVEPESEEDVDDEEAEGEAAEDEMVVKHDGDTVAFKASTFAELHLSRALLKACQALGYDKPTPIQSLSDPLIDELNTSVCQNWFWKAAGEGVRAFVGEGASYQTAAFMLPLMERLMHRPRRVAATRVLVIVPTRELAVQVHAMTERLAQFTDIRAALVVGGLSLQAQAAALRSRPEVVVATPARLVDHLHNTAAVDLDQLAALVLDEADRMLEIGFKDQVEQVIKSCPKQRQTLLFSATLSAAVDSLAAMSLVHPAHLTVDRNQSTPVLLTEEVVRLKEGRESDKESMLLALCTRSFSTRCIIFAKTKHQ